MGDMTRAGSARGSCSIYVGGSVRRACVGGTALEQSAESREPTGMHRDRYRSEQCTIAYARHCLGWSAADSHRGAQLRPERWSYARIDRTVSDWSTPSATVVQTNLRVLHRCEHRLQRLTLRILAKLEHAPAQPRPAGSLESLERVPVGSVESAGGKHAAREYSRLWPLDDRENAVEPLLVIDLHRRSNANEQTH